MRKLLLLLLLVTNLLYAEFDKVATTAGQLLKLDVGARATATPRSCQANPSTEVAYQMSARSQSTAGMVSVCRWAFRPPTGGAAVTRLVYQT